LGRDFADVSPVALKFAASWMLGASPLPVYIVRMSDGECISSNTDEHQASRVQFRGSFTGSLETLLDRKVFDTAQLGYGSLPRHVGFQNSDLQGRSRPFFPRSRFI
jgi:hypothetical protein